MHFSICDMIKWKYIESNNFPTKDEVRTIKVTCGDLILSKARGRILHVATRGGSGITTHHELPATTRRITPNDERHLREHKALH